MTSNAGRLDVISRPNLAGVARTWTNLVPDDMPPSSPDQIGNCPPGTFALYAGSAGWVRCIFREELFATAMGQSSNVHWMMSMAHLNIGGMNHPINWLPAVTPSVRIFLPEGTYLHGEVAHVLAHDSTIPLGYLHALVV